ncbi:MAG: SDR family oxidoreductase [Chloroflexi bacterium]|nr:SDR family oxidoreductase [Chloroflexota bacterium]MBT4073630.1 SDR family oxidoreductase [Chloroflexota bacterium]MBT5320276.1 SDR family oxidoreductase [Chloroflexota bacterium]MBT6682508.1 SDR family oxidoreductase [Chloroflexota bacterium]
MPRFDGQVAIVTGGALGIGGATARRLASEGASVLIADFNDEAAVANVDRIADAGGRAMSLTTDVSKGDDIREAVETAVNEWGRLDIMVNNAFPTDTRDAPWWGSAVSVPEEGWDLGMSMLTKALYLGAKYAVPEMSKIGGGSIVNLASVHGLLMAPNSLVYEAGKSAVIGMTRQMAIDFGPIGIRVNCICPGHIVTEGLGEMWEDNAEGLKFFDQQYPVRRTGVPDDIASGIAFLCSDEASFITGHPLVIDGGLSIQLQEDLGVAQGKYARENEFRMP